MSIESIKLLKHALNDVLEKIDLDEKNASDVMHALTDDGVPGELIASFLTALRYKGETAEELRGFAKAMRALAIKPKLSHGQSAVDIVGTGGDNSGSFNISTGSALLAAATGLTVIKHGNRSVSSKSGSADVLEELGIAMPSTELEVGLALEKFNFAFLFAPSFHPAMKNVAPVRAAIGIRTAFNILGPLVNPMEPPFGVIGAYSENMAELMANALAGMNIERAFVIHGEPGWDEATPVGPFILFDVHPGKVEREVRDPIDYRIKRCEAADLMGGDASYNAEHLRRVLAGREQGAHLDALVLGAALALEVTGTTQSFRASMSQAREAINAGRGTALLKSLASR